MAAQQASTVLGSCDAERSVVKSLLQKNHRRTPSGHSIKRLAICIAGSLRDIWTAAPTLHVSLNLASLPQSIETAAFVSSWSDFDTECACKEKPDTCSSAWLDEVIRRVYTPLNVHSVRLHKEADSTLFGWPRTKIMRSAFQYWLWGDSVAQAMRWGADVLIKQRPDFAFLSSIRFQWHELDSLRVGDASCKITEGTICSLMSDIHEDDHIIDDTLLLGEATTMRKVFDTMFDNVVNGSLHGRCGHKHGSCPEMRLQQHISRQHVHVQKLSKRSRYGLLAKDCEQRDPVS